MGVGRLVCTSEFNEDNGKLVKVESFTTDYVTTTRITNRLAVFDVTTPEKYKVSVISTVTEEINGEPVTRDVVEFEKYYVVNDGQYVEVQVGLDVYSWTGLKRIVNAHLETEFVESGKLPIGHEVDLTLLDGTHHPMLLAAVNHDTKYYPHQLIFVSKYLLPELRAMNLTRTMVGGWNDMNLCRELNSARFYTLLPDDCKNAISERKFYTGAGGSDNIVESEAKIWIPRIYEIIGQAYGGLYKEFAQCEIFPIFSDKSARVKKLGETGTASVWLTATNRANGNYPQITIHVDAAGNHATDAYWPETVSFGILPCFHIIADDNPEVILNTT